MENEIKEHLTFYLPLWEKYDFQKEGGGKGNMIFNVKYRHFITNTISIPPASLLLVVERTTSHKNLNILR